MTRKAHSAIALLLVLSPLLTGCEVLEGITLTQTSTVLYTTTVTGPPPTTNTTLPDTTTPLQTTTSQPTTATTTQAPPPNYTGDGNITTVVGFWVTIERPDVDFPRDSAWESCTGGSLNIEVALPDMTVPRAKYIDEFAFRGPVTGSSSGNPGSEEIMENGTGRFRVTAEGVPSVALNIQSITIEDLVFEQLPVPGTNEWGYASTAPGAPKFGIITLRVHTEPGNRQIYDWWKDAASGNVAGKTVELTLLARDGSDSRQYIFGGCVPIAYQPFMITHASNPASEEITLVYSSLEIHASGLRQAMAEWLNGALNNNPWATSVDITEILKDGTDGRVFTYTDCFPTSYVFPSPNIYNHGVLYEEVFIKAGGFTVEN